MNRKCNVQGATRRLQSFIAVQGKRFSPKAPRFLDIKKVVRLLAVCFTLENQEGSTG